MMESDIRTQPAPHNADNPCGLPAEDLLVSEATFGPDTPLHMREEQMEAEFAYIIQCYTKLEVSRHG